MNRLNRRWLAIPVSLLLAFLITAVFSQLAPTAQSASPAPFEENFNEWQEIRWAKQGDVWLHEETSGNKCLCFAGGSVTLDIITPQRKEIFFDYVIKGNDTVFTVSSFDMPNWFKDEEQRPWTRLSIIGYYRTRFLLKFKAENGTACIDNITITPCARIPLVTPSTEPWKNDLWNLTEFFVAICCGLSILCYLPMMAYLREAPLNIFAALPFIFLAILAVMWLVSGGLGFFDWLSGMDKFLR